MLQPATNEAFQLLMQGAAAMARIEEAGIRIDTVYLEKSIKEVTNKIAEKEQAIKEDPTYKLWERRFGNNMKLGSRQQLGHIIFDQQGHKRNPFMGQSNDAASFEHLKHPFIRNYQEVERLKKALSTNLLGIQKEVVNGKLHCFFDLHTTESYRSCVAKGTLIEVVRDVSKAPKGIPIEEVRAGDFVYCYNKNKRLTIRRVKWAGKTGTRKVVRLHWTARGKRGHLDLTPEHRIRLVDGSYVAAQDLDFSSGQHGTRRFAFVHSLAMGRDGDRIWETRNPVDLHDHRLVYKCLVGPLEDHMVVHHKDHNHYNNLPGNLEKKTKADHAKHHACDNLTDSGRINAAKARRRHIADGTITFKQGKDHHSWIHITRFSMLRMLARCGGSLAKMDHCFAVMKNKAKLLGLDIKEIQNRYDAEDCYLSKGRLLRAQGKRQRQQLKELKCNYYKMHKNFSERLFATIHNHRIESLEWINKTVDVYDIEVEGCHNFIANEICVHNSSSRINLQNQPIRNKDISKIVRSCMIPRKNHVFLEPDLETHEVRISYCYNLDPRLKYDVLHGDMHTDRAKELYLLSDEELGPVDKDPGKLIRYIAKNRFVFAQFYGSYFAQCAPELWDAIAIYDLKTAQGMSLFDHLKSKGIKKLGACDPEQKPKKGTYEQLVFDVEKRMWEENYTVYNQWRKNWWNLYQSQGGINTKTGFKLEGFFRRNQILCDPIQGSAFHCLLWSIIEIQKKMRKRKMRTKIVVQIHDSMVLDTHENEIEDVVRIVRQTVLKDLPRHWDWITIPLVMGFDVCKENWYSKTKLERIAA